MHALTFQAVESVAHQVVPDPVPTAGRDAIVRVTAAGLCGSDLHPFLGRETGLDIGTVMGHELVGRIVELGDEARHRLRSAPEGARFDVGDRVVAPFTTSCGECPPCRRGLTARCDLGQLFGWVADGRGLQGAQAEFVRVPMADATLVKVPDTIEDDGLALLAGDILSTAAFGTDLARVGGEDVVAVVGCGPVGLLAVRTSLAAGARAVVAVDPVPSRRAAAERFGARTAGLERGEARAAVDEFTGGRGADAAIEAVGTPSATRTAADLLRPGATLAAVGVHVEPHLALSPGEIYDLNLTYAGGRCPARRYLPGSLKLLSADADLLASLISHRLPLTEGPEAYRRFAAREPGWDKVVLIP